MDMPFDIKLMAISKLHEEATKATELAQMKNQLLEDAVKDLFHNELGLPKDQTNIPLPKLLQLVREKK